MSKKEKTAQKKGKEKKAKQEGVTLEEKIKNLKKQYGTIYEIAAEVDFEGGEEMVFIFKKPGRSELGRYLKTAMTDAYRAMHNLVFDCLVYPEKDVVVKMVEEEPGLIVALGNELQDLVGINKNFTRKKL
ncbi:hypothetical protein JCM16358_23180 [Halanaerocella petrolearia]